MVVNQENSQPNDNQDLASYLGIRNKIAEKIWDKFPIKDHPKKWSRNFIKEFLSHFVDEIEIRFKENPRLISKHIDYPDIPNAVRSWAALSPSTFERIFRKDDYKPNDSTLNRFAVYLGFDSFTDLVLNIEDDKIVVDPPIPKTPRWRKALVLLTFIVATIVIALVINKNRKPEEVFKDTNAFNILVLPFDKLSYQEGFVYDYHKSIAKRFNSLKEMDSLNIEVVVLESPVIETFAKGYAIGLEYGADMVVFGDFAHYANRDEYSVYLKYVLIDSLYNSWQLAKQQDEIKCGGDATIEELRNGVLTGCLEEQVYSILGNIESTKGKWSKAIQYYQTAQQSGDSQMPGLYRGLAFAHYMVSNLKEAYENITTAIQLDSSDAFSFNNLGVYARMTGNLEKSEWAFKKAIEIKPDYASAYNGLGNTMGQQAKFEDALKWYEECIKYNPSDTLVYYNKAWIHLNLEQYQQAYNSAKKYVNLTGDKDDPLLDYTTAALLMSKNKLAEAKEIALNIKKESPNDPDVFALLSEIEIRSGNEDIARYYANQVDSINASKGIK